MTVEIEYTDEFERWWEALPGGAQDAIDVIVGLLAARGLQLGFPYSSAIHGSRFGHMRELRVQHQGEPIRILYAFDPRRVAVLLIGGTKTGNERWYEKFLPVADRLYEEHLKSI